MLKLFLRLLLIGLLLSCTDKSAPAPAAGPVWGIPFPPVSTAEQRAFTAPVLQELGMKHIRFAEEWAFREPQQGQFNWSPLDKRLAWAEAEELQVLLTVQANAPDWACTGAQNEKSCVFDTAAFSVYINALLQRYANRLHKIQFGNEWQTSFWYAGTAADFIAANNILYEAVAAHSPATKVVLGGFTTISARFLTACATADFPFSFYNDEGDLFDKQNLPQLCQTAEFAAANERIEQVMQQAQYDELDLHLYDDAEQWPLYVQHMRSLSSKPIIVTEFGGPNINFEPATEAYQAERTQVYLATLADLPIEEAYYFRLVEGSENPAHATTGLFDTDLEKKENLEVLKGFSVR